MKRNLLTFILLAATTLAANAQGKYAGTTIYDRIGHGQDSIDVLNAITLYREAYKDKNWNESYQNWQIVFDKAPLAQSRTYTDGVNIMQQLIAGSQDDAKKAEYFNTLMKIYDQRLANLDDLNSFATAKTTTTRGNILTRKANDYFTYAPQTADKLDTSYKMFREGIQDMGVNEVQGFVLYNFIICSHARYNANPGANREDFINDYFTIKDVCENLLEQAKEFAFTDSIATQEDSIRAAELEEKGAKIVAQYQPTFNKCQELFFNSNAANCSDLDKLYAEKVEANKDNKDYLKQVLKVLSDFECDSSALYTSIFDVLYPKKEKKVTTSSGSIDFYLEEYAEETSGSRKAKLAASIAQIYYKQGRLGDCEKWCHNALAAQPTYGHAYLLIANCIVRKAPAATQNVNQMLNRSLYFCLAIDKCNRAKAVDPACASQANRQIASYNGNLFPKSEAFMMGIKAGERRTILGEATTLKFR